MLRKGWGNGGKSAKAKSQLLEDGSAALMGRADRLNPGDPLFDPADDENFVLVSGDAEAYPSSPGRGNYDPMHRKASTLVTGCYQPLFRRDRLTRPRHVSD